jgi:hypothetical protein
MMRSAAQLLVAVVLAVGLVAMPHGAGTVCAAAKKKAEPAKSSKSSKKETKSSKSSKKESTARDKKSKAADKKSKRDSEKTAKSSKRDKRAAEKSSNKTAKTSKRSSRDDRTAKSSTSSKKRGKNDGDDDSTATRSRRVRDVKRSSPEPREVRAASSPTPAVVKTDEAYADEEEEEITPKAANRLVADIPAARVVEIQNALIRVGVLAGPPTGIYDQSTFSAMSTFQTRNGWKPVGDPTALSLKALGVRKNSGQGQYEPAKVLEATALPGN